MLRAFSFPARATGSSRGPPRRCSTAPADAFETAGVTPTARCSGITTPCTPHAWAVRSSVPKFCGSCRLSSTSRAARALDGLEQLVEVGVDELLGLGERRPGGGRRARRSSAVAVEELDADTSRAGVARSADPGRGRRWRTRRGGRGGGCAAPRRRRYGRKGGPSTGSAFETPDGRAAWHVLDDDAERVLAVSRTLSASAHCLTPRSFFA